MMTVDWQNEGRVALEVACDGSVTGTITLDQVAVASMRGRRRTRCTNPDVGITVSAGSVSLRGGNVVFDLPGETTQVEIGECSGDLNMGFSGRPPIPIGIRLGRGQVEGNVVRGTTMSWTAPRIWLRFREQLGGSTTATASWQLTGPPPPRPPVVSVTSQYQQYFLQGVGPLLDTFTAAVDWQDGTPGDVWFTLGGQTRAGLDPERDSTYVATFDLADLAATTTLTAEVTNVEGASVTASLDVTIVPMPPWGRAVQWDPRPASALVLYQGRLEVPERPIDDLAVMIDPRLPVLGGRWGLQPTQLIVNLAADSLANPLTAQVRGTGGLALGPTSVGLRVTGTTRTRLGPTSLDLLDGRATLGLARPLSIQQTIGLGSLLPIIGLDGVIGDGLLAEILEALSPVGIDVEAAATASASGTFGVANDTLRIREGSGDLGISARFMGRLGSRRVLYAAIGADVDGVLRLRLAPEPRAVSGCRVELSFRVEGKVIGFDPVVYQSASATALACSTAGAGSRALLAALVPDTPAAAASGAQRPSGAPPPSAAASGDRTPSGDALLTASTRPPGWLAEESVAETSSTSGPTGLLTQTELARRALDRADPALAVSPSGIVAMAWSTEDPRLPPQQAAQIRLRLATDGTSWGPPIELTADTLPDLSPALAFADDERLVVAWIRQGHPELRRTVRLGDYLDGLEVAYAVVDSGSGAVVEEGQLTHDRLRDEEVRLAAAADGSVWAAWLSSPAGAGASVVREPEALVAARWSAGGWTTPELVSDGLRRTVGMRIAAWDADRAVLTWDTALDETPALKAGSRGEAGARAHRVEVAQHTPDGWQRIEGPGDGERTGSLPMVALDPAGGLLLAWWRDGALMGSRVDAKAATEGSIAAPETWIAARSGILGTPDESILLVTPSGGRVVAWTDRGPSGPAVWVASAARDGSFGEPVILFSDPDLEGSLSLAATPDDDVVLGLSIAAAVGTGADDGLTGRPARARWSEDRSIIVAYLDPIEH